MCISGCGRYSTNLKCCEMCQCLNNKFTHTIECFVQHQELQKIWLTNNANLDVGMIQQVNDFIESFNKPIYDNIAEIFVLPADKSMIVIKNIIENSKLEPIVCFDYDQTISLTTRNNFMVQNTLRGGIETKMLFEYLAMKNIPWFILSARGISSISIVYRDMLKYNLPLPNLCINNKLNIIFDDKIFKQPNSITELFMPSRELVFACDIKYKNQLQKIYCGIYHNSIACSSEGLADSSYAYEKDVAIELGMYLYNINPQLIIFVDDNAKNIYTMFKHYRKNSRKVHFIGIIYEPIKPEADHNHYMEKINKKIWSTLIPSNLMSAFVVHNIIK